MKWMALIALIMTALAAPVQRMGDSTRIDSVGKDSTTPPAVTVAAAGDEPLGALTVSNTAMQLLTNLHVPEFLGTAIAFSMMTWALRSRRVV